MFFTAYVRVCRELEDTFITGMANNLPNISGGMPGYPPQHNAQPGPGMPPPQMPNQHTMPGPGQQPPVVMSMQSDMGGGPPQIPPQNQPPPPTTQEQQAELISFD